MHHPSSNHVENTGMVALITGANSGIGLAIAHRLLSLSCLGHAVDRFGHTPTTSPPTPGPHVTLILACRNPVRANQARNHLLASFPLAQVHLLLLDLASPDAIISAAADARARFPRITHLFCNAGVMPTVGLSWKAIARDLVCDPIDLFTLGTHAFVQPRGQVDASGRGQVFMANTAGHYLLIRGLEPALVAGRARVVFTSSKTGMRTFFDAKDVECRGGTHPYQSSKYAQDALVGVLNRKYHDLGVSFFTFCPGTVYTGIIAIPLPAVVMLGFYYLMRLLIPSMTITTHHGATAALLLGTRPLQELNTRTKYFSRASPTGKEYVDTAALTKAAGVTDEDELMHHGHLVAQVCEKIYVAALMENRARVEREDSVNVAE